MKIRSLIYDKIFIKNNPDIINKLISLKEPIPMRIHSVIIDYYPKINRQRLLLFGDDNDFMDQVREERFIARELGAVESREYHNDLALDFIKKHSQFRPIISHVKVMDGNFNEIEIIPINQYLAEN